MNLSTRRIKMIRTHIDPQIGPNPKLAFSITDPLLQAIDLEMELTPIGVWAKWIDKRNNNEPHEHLVPFANIQSIKLEPKPTELSSDEDDVIEMKRKPGRPPKLDQV